MVENSATVRKGNGFGPTSVLPTIHELSRGSAKQAASSRVEIRGNLELRPPEAIRQRNTLSGPSNSRIISNWRLHIMKSISDGRVQQPERRPPEPRAVQVH